ncbi:MAG: hypothetical protein FWH46_05035 [Methanimicrococcus sp.]|nr:hypothetical protein [Methanimicrococcus sp.]
MQKYCQNCGETIANENAFVCSNCGKPISDEASYYNRYSSDGSTKVSEIKATPSYLSSTQTKSPFLATILSFFWTGLGQVYNGKFWKGIFFLFAVPIGFVCLFIPGLILWVWCLWDAYKESEKMNNGELPYAEPTAWQLIIFLCLPFVLIFTFYFVFMLVLFFLAAAI